ncbi:mCG147045 [Mus musculus]|nr:mCG147045 [Mus musculus]
MDRELLNVGFGMQIIQAAEAKQPKQKEWLSAVSGRRGTQKSERRC